jgi:hypothetical protein
VVGLWVKRFNKSHKRPNQFLYRVRQAALLILATQNLPAPTIADGSDYFNTVLYTGDGSTQAITGVGFQPDLVWIKKPHTGKIS